MSVPCTSRGTKKLKKIRGGATYAATRPDQMAADVLIGERVFVWSQETRPRLAGGRRRGRAPGTGLLRRPKPEEQWAAGHRALRQMGAGGQWRAMRKDLRPRSTVHDYFDLWTYEGTLERIHHALYEQCRERAQRKASPTAAIIDSQSVKSAEKGGVH